MTNHVDLTNAELHEPKNIIDASTADAGKVLTPSSSTAGTSELRKLVESEINEKVCYVTLRFDNIDTVGDVYMPMSFAGTVDAIYCVINGALGTADTTLTAKVNGTSMTDGAITVAYSGSAAGDVDSCTPTAQNTFSQGDYIQVTSNTAGSGTVDAVLMFTITRD